MSVYIIGTSLSVLFAYIATHISTTKQMNIKQKKVATRIFQFLSFLPLTLIMAVRYGVGTDFFSYQEIYLYGYGKTRAHKETGYLLFQNILKLFSKNPQFIIIVTSVIICASYFIFFYRESINPAYSILLFVINKDYFMSMNGMRQYLAAAIILFSVPNMREKKWKSVLAAICIAFFIHRTSAIFLLLFAMYNFEVKPVMGIIAIAVTFAGSNVILRFLMPLIRRWGYSYFDADSSYFNKSGDINLTYLSIYLSFFVLILYLFKTVCKYDTLKLLYSAVLLNLVMAALSPVMPTNFNWVMVHLNSIIAAYTPQLTSAISSKVLRWAINATIVIAYILITIPSIMGGNQDVLPYRSIWSY